jgi:hypothetical protein
MLDPGAGGWAEGRDKAEIANGELESEAHWKAAEAAGLVTVDRVADGSPARSIGVSATPVSPLAMR